MKLVRFWKSLARNRYGEAFIYAVTSILLSVILGAVCSLIGGRFWYLAQSLFLLFFAPGIVSALLLVLTNIKTNLSWGFGCGLYYGSLFLIAIFKKAGDTSLPYIAGISLTIAICYCIYLKNFSNKK